MEKDFLNYRPDDEILKKVNSEVESIVDSSKQVEEIKMPVLLEVFFRNAPDLVLRRVNSYIERFDLVIKEIKEESNNLDILEAIEKATDEHNINSVRKLQKKLSSDIKASALDEIFSTVYSINKDLRENKVSFSIDSFGEEVNQQNADEKMRKKKEQLLKNQGNINYDALYLDTLSNHCFIDKANSLEYFLADVDNLKVQKKSVKKTPELNGVLVNAFGEMTNDGDRKLDKLNQIMDSNYYKTNNNKINHEKAIINNSLASWDEIEGLGHFASESLKGNLNNSNHKYLNAVEDYLKITKTRKLLLDEYVAELHKKNEIRKLY